MKTLARLLGPEGQLEGEMMLPACPPSVRAAVQLIDWPAYLDSLLTPATTSPISFATIEYVREFVVPGDDEHPGQATYRRPIQWRD